MKTLVLFRHGDAEWSGGIDHERTLSPEGERASRVMGRFLRATGVPPNSVITSSAVRAQSSANLAIEAGGWSPQVRVTRALYEATPFTILDEIRTEPTTSGSLMVVGHQPTCGELSGLMIQGNPVRFVTAAMIRIDLAIEHWSDAEYGCGELVWYVPPAIVAEAYAD